MQPTTFQQISIVSRQQGRQMPPVLNLLNIHTAVIGNHDFDFGLDVLQGLVGQCNFPWLLVRLSLVQLPLTFLTLAWTCCRAWWASATSPDSW